MYPAPPSIDSRVFARIPDQHRVRDRRNRWIDVQRGGAPTDCFLEGPSFDRDGKLFIADYRHGIMVVDSRPRPRAVPAVTSHEIHDAN